MPNHHLGVLCRVIKENMLFEKSWWVTREPPPPEIVTPDVDVRVFGDAIVVNLFTSQNCTEGQLCAPIAVARFEQPSLQIVRYNDTGLKVQVRLWRAAAWEHTDTHRQHPFLDTHNKFGRDGTACSPAWDLCNRDKRLAEYLGDRTNTPDVEIIVFRDGQRNVDLNVRFTRLKLTLHSQLVVSLGEWLTPIVTEALWRCVMKDMSAPQFRWPLVVGGLAYATVGPKQSDLDLRFFITPLTLHWLGLKESPWSAELSPNAVRTFVLLKSDLCLKVNDDPTRGFVKVSSSRLSVLVAAVNSAATRHPLDMIRDSFTYAHLGLSDMFYDTSFGAKKHVARLQVMTVQLYADGMLHGAELVHGAAATVAAIKASLKVDLDRLGRTALFGSTEPQPPVAAEVQLESLGVTSMGSLTSLPVFHFQASNLEFSYALGQTLGSFDISASAGMAAFYLHPRRCKWEPCVERWDLAVCLQKKEFQDDCSINAEQGLKVCAMSSTSTTFLF
jgi:hypothetical protein